MKALETVRLTSMKSFWLMGLIVLACAACAPVSLEKQPVQFIHATSDNLFFLNTDLQLRVLPNSTVTAWAEKDRATQVDFLSPLGIGTIYDYFHAQLSSLNWQRSSLQEQGDTLTASYERNGLKLRVLLHHSKGEAFRLETR